MLLSFPARPTTLAAALLTFASICTVTTAQTPIAPNQPAGEPKAKPLPDTNANGLPIDQGAGTFTPIELDDELPYPGKGSTLASRNGDSRVDAPQSDRFWLGFAAGTKTPSSDETIDPRLLAAIDGLGGDARPGAFVYGFVMLSKRLTAERDQELTNLGCRTLGTHPWACIKVALPIESVTTVAALPFVRWVGVADPWQKLHPNFQAQLVTAQSAEPLALYVNVFESDLNPNSTFERVGRVETYDPGSTELELAPETSTALRWQSRGWQEERLTALGVEVVEYVDSIRAFRVRATPERVGDLVAQDFVLFVEAEQPATLGHEETMPLIGADYTRQFYDGGTNGVAITGIVDSGMEISHEALSSHYSWGFDLTTNGDGNFEDSCGHGSHCIGTILADPPTANVRFRGAAYRLGSLPTKRFRSAKIFDQEPGDPCAWNTSSSMATIFGTMRGNVTDSNNNVSGPPHVINHSWGSGPGSPNAWIGTEADARAVDDEIWSQDQQHIFIAHNYGPNPGTVSQQGASKNNLTVGSISDFVGTTGDPGNNANSSGRGPCGDGRWKPNVCAPGTSILSVNSNDLDGYTSKSGTSMAAPHVTGVASQLVDHYSFVRYEPARLSALMMGTATTKDDQVYTTPSDANLDNYGAGRIDAYRAHFPDSEALLLNWGFAQGFSGFQSGDFTVDAGATRLVIVMHYKEPAASAGASQALVNDFDLYVDRAPFDAAGNVGEYVAQQSGIDNTEIRIVDNPPAGTYRWKTWPASVGLTGVAKMSINVNVIYGDTTPDGTLTLTKNTNYVQPNEDVQITATVTNPSFIASGVYLDTTSHVGANLQNATTTLEDGVVTNLTDNNGPDPGFDLLLGNVIHDNSRAAKWTVRYSTEGTKTWTTQARSDNWVDETDSTTVIVDGTAPNLPTNLGSSTHAVNVWSNDPSITYTWSLASDALSGVDGYGVFATSTSSAPGNTKDIENVSSWSETIASTTASRWFNIKSVDNAGNWSSSFASVGPFKIDLDLPNPAASLTSSTHATNVWSTNPNITFNWTAATDAHSGIGGYAHQLSFFIALAPGSTPTIGPTTSTTLNTTGGSSVYFTLRSIDAAGNADDAWLTAGPYKIDPVAPTTPTNVTSTTHTVNAWSQATSMTFTWTAATDALSGMAGYVTALTQSPLTTPTGAVDTIATTKTVNATSSPNGWWFHVRARDVAGNLGPVVHLGPFFVDTGTPVISAVTIDNGAPATTAAAVTLQIAASNATSGVNRMRFQNDGGVFSAWEPFAATKSWNLTNNGGSTSFGTRTVTVQVEDLAGNVMTASDSIYRYVAVEYFGQACAGQLGEPKFGIDGIPGLNQPITFAVENTLATTGLLYLGLSKTNWSGTPLPLVIPNSGCFVNISLDLLLVSGPLFTIPAVIPNEPAAVGIPLHFQWLLGGDPAASVVTTKGATMVISGL
jgi:hypothetical protein